MPFLALTSSLPEVAVRILNAEAGEAEFQINLFWIIAQAGSFVLFLVIVYLVAFRRIGGILEERRSRIEQGLRDADQARVEREQAANERLAVLVAARQEAEEILARSQRVADEDRERDMTETRAQIEQMRERAAADIVAEKERALAEVRAQVADLALLAAGRVVGETMSEPRERRLVEEFLGQMGSSPGNAGSPQARN
jgi:F-type H+-transporting ATPase subunit b